MQLTILRPSTVLATLLCTLPACGGGGGATMTDSASGSSSTGGNSETGADTGAPTTTGGSTTGGSDSVSGSSSSTADPSTSTAATTSTSTTEPLTSGSSTGSSGDDASTGSSSDDASTGSSSGESSTSSESSSSGESSTGEIVNCAEWQPLFDAEVLEIRGCAEDSECGQELLGTSCGCTRNWVARLDADLADFMALVDKAVELGCDLPFNSTCDCPGADGFACETGICTWNYI